MYTECYEKEEEEESESWLLSKGRETTLILLQNID